MSLAVEDTNHFLLKCKLFQNLRQEMITTVSEIVPPTLNTLLFGNPDLRNEANESIFLAVSLSSQKTKLHVSIYGRLFQGHQKFNYQRRRYTVFHLSRMTTNNLISSM